MDRRTRRGCGDLQQQLPPVIPSNGILGKLSAEAAQAMDLPEGIPVVAGGGDRPCEALGSGIGADGVMESTGTTSNVSAPLGKAPATMEGARFFATASRLLPLRARDEHHRGDPRWFPPISLDTKSESGPKRRAPTPTRSSARQPLSAPGATASLRSPFSWVGESTRWNPDARGVLFGLTLKHTKGDVARSLMEGVAYEVAACLDVLKRAGHSRQGGPGVGGAPRRGIGTRSKPISAEWRSRCPG